MRNISLFSKLIIFLLFPQLISYLLTNLVQSNCLFEPLQQFQLISHTQLLYYKIFRNAFTYKKSIVSIQQNFFKVSDNLIMFSILLSRPLHSKKMHFNSTVHLCNSWFINILLKDLQFCKEKKQGFYFLSCIFYDQSFRILVLH